MIVVNESKRVLELEQVKRSLELQLSEMSRKFEQQQEQIKLARMDALTGLRSRAGISEYINAMLKTGGEGTFFIMDMDNFKQVNDTYGHVEGDKVLVRFARALVHATEKDDLLARLGGDEFIVFSQKAMEKDEIARKARRIIDTVERGLVTPGKLIKVTVSVGISRAPVDGITYENLYNNADKALYSVKKRGKNSFSFYEDVDEGLEQDRIVKEQKTLAEITYVIRERKMEGSLMVEYTNFEKIYRFLERNIARNKREVQCVLFTIDDEGFDNADDKLLQRQMEHLKHAVSTSLRRGDVTSNYSSSQILALLMDINRENADMVVARILDKYRKEAGAEALNINYDSQQLG